MLLQDPNSLSNLDQDLPNFAQHDIPIHSLPAEWLWCETWYVPEIGSPVPRLLRSTIGTNLCLLLAQSFCRCGSESRPQAKTIDLCNNPKTKEPKLASARRIVAEWPNLNDEVNEFTRRALGWLEGNITDDELADTSYRVKLMPMVEGVIGQASDPSTNVEKIQDHDEL